MQIMKTDRNLTILITQSFVLCYHLKFNAICEVCKKIFKNSNPFKMILNMGYYNMSHILRIVITRAFKKCKVCYAHLQTKEAIAVQRAAGTYLAPGI
jgi:hypothetical protein